MLFTSLLACPGPSAVVSPLTATLRPLLEKPPPAPPVPGRIRSSAPRLPPRRPGQGLKQKQQEEQKEEAAAATRAAAGTAVEAAVRGAGAAAAGGS